MVIRLVIDFGKLIKVVLKREVGKGVDKWGRRYGGCWVLWPLCVFGCISVVVRVLVSGITGAGVMYSWYSRLVSGCIGEKGSLVTSWGRIGGRGEDGGKNG
jgi:hypothetical protein